MSWISLSPHTPGLGPDTQAGSVLCHEYLVWNQWENPGSGGDKYVDRVFAFAAKRATTNGRLPQGGFMTTPWYRGIEKVRSERSYSFWVPQSWKPWYRKHWGDNSLAVTVPNRVHPEWDRQLGALHCGSNLQNKAKTKCMESIAQSKFDASEFLAGSIQTADMLAKTLSVLILTIVDLRKGRFSRAARRLRTQVPKNPKDVADAWLQMQYGWRPLVGDAYAAVELLKTQLASGELLMKATGTQTESLPDSRCFAAPPAPIPFSIQNRGSKKSVRVECVYRVSNPSAQLWAKVNFVNPLYFAWVATPYSFLVDWLIPVGDWLSAMGANTGCEFVGAWETHRLQIDASAEGPNTSLVNGHYGIYHPNYPSILPKVSYQVMVIHRYVLSTWPKPELYINTTPFKSPTRLLNAIALATSMSYR